MPRLDDVDLSEDGSIADAEIAAEPKELDIPDEFDEKEEVESSADEDVDENGEDEDGEEYVVEKVLGHEWHRKGKKRDLVLYVKWRGYEDPKDYTMEPEENLAENTALERYFSSIGGRPDPAEGDKMPPPPVTNGVKKKRKSNPNLKEEADVSAPKRGRKSKGGDEEGGWMPSGKSWEEHVKEVQTIERDSRTQTLQAFLEWTNGKKAKVDIDLAYKKCPIKMLKFYESHLVFKES